MKKYLLSKILLMTFLMFAAVSSLVSAEEMDVEEWLAEQGHTMMEVPRPNYDGRYFMELVGNKMTYYPKQGVTYYEMLVVREVPDRDVRVNMGAKYMVGTWQFKKYDNGYVRGRWATSEGLDREFNRVRFQEMGKDPKTNGWYDTKGRMQERIAEVGFEYFEAFGGTLETGEVLDTKDPYDKKR